MNILRLLRIGLVAGLLPVVACDEGGIRGLTSGERADATRARYGREMIFVAGDATAAAVLDFTTVDAGSRLRRSARGWAEAGSGWTPLYDLSWESAPVRRAWRLVPHGPIRIRVGLGDDIEALMVRDEDGVIATLETGDYVSEWTPFRTSQMVLREASLSLGGEPIRGWLVDARFGVSRAVEADEGGETGPNGVVPPAVPQSPAGRTESVGDPARAGSQDTAAAADANPTAAPVRSLRAVLFGTDGATLVLGETENGISGWLRTVDRELVLPNVTLSAPTDERGWRVEAAGPSPLTGRLVSLDEQPMPLSPGMVRGTIRVGGADIEMRGVLRPPAQPD